MTFVSFESKTEVLVHPIFSKNLKYITMRQTEVCSSSKKFRGSS